MPRRILRVDAGEVSVAREQRFAFEIDLHKSIAAHPEVLPSEDVGLGPLVALANELDLGAGPMDLLAVDARGRLVITEFKRGTENPDVRKVVAQVLDYGSSLWRLTYEELEQRCQACTPKFDSLAQHVGETLHGLNEEFDEEVFMDGVTRCLAAGSFVFLYVARDLDERTRRIMAYLADGARMTFFAVEVDQFHAGSAQTSVLVPRTAFVPSWIIAPLGVQEPVFMSVETKDLLDRMEGFAKETKLTIAQRKTGRAYLPRTLEPVLNASSGIGVYATKRGMEVNLSVFKPYGEEATAEHLLAALGSATGISMEGAHDWPSVPCASVNKNWDRVRSDVLIPYFEARALHANVALAVENLDPMNGAMATASVPGAAAL
jgi:hypothetical protein